mgnify:FL=1
MAVTKDGGYRWVVINIWHFASVSAFMVIYTMGILLPTITDDLSLSPSQQGLLGSAPHWGTILLAIPLGLAASQMSPKLLTSVTLLMLTLCLFLQSWAPVFAVLLLGRLLFGIAIIAQQPARALLTRQWFRANETIVVNGFSNVFFGLVVGGGLVLSPVILDALGDDWRSTLRMFGFYFTAITVVWVLLGRDRKTEEFQSGELQRTVEVLRGALRHRNLWICGVGFAGATMSLSAFLSFYPTFMLDRYDISLNFSGGILALDVVVGGIVGMGVGYAAAKTRKEGRFLQVLGILMIASNIAMILTGWVPILFVLALFNGFAWTFFPILITVPFNLRGIRPRELVVAFSFTMMLVSLGQALGPLLTGFIEEISGSLKFSLFVMSFTSATLVLAGLTLNFDRQSTERSVVVAAPGD